jgi:hypothetical protein
LERQINYFKIKVNNKVFLLFYIIFLSYLEMSRRNSNSFILQNRDSIIQRRKSVFSQNRVSKFHRVDFFQLFRKQLSKNRRKKYKGMEPEKIQIEKINQIIFNKKTHLVSIYIDTIQSCEPSEFLSKFYHSKKGYEYLIILTEFYDNNTKFSPAYCRFNKDIQTILYRNLKEKQKLIDKNENRDTSNNRLLNEISCSQNENGNNYRFSQENFLNSEFLRDIETENNSSKTVTLENNKKLETPTSHHGFNSKLTSSSRNESKKKLNQSLRSIENLINRIENIENKNYLNNFSKNVPEPNPGLILQSFLQGTKYENFNNVLITTLTSESISKNEISNHYHSPVRTNKLHHHILEKTHKFADTEKFLGRLNDAKELKKKQENIIMKMHKDMRLLRTYELDVKCKDPIVSRIQPAFFLPPLDVNMSEIKSASQLNERKIKFLETRNKNESVSKTLKMKDVFKSADLYDKKKQNSFCGFGNFNQSVQMVSPNTALSFNEIQDSNSMRVNKYKNKMQQRKIESYNTNKYQHNSFRSSIGLD